MDKTKKDIATDIREELDFFNDRIEEHREKAKKFVAKSRRNFEKMKKEWKSSERTETLVSRGKKAVREVDENSRQAVILQYRLLTELMQENKNTEYGQKYDFASIRSIDDYKARVPFSAYDDYEPYIKRMTEGEGNLISANPPLYYALTSGSVGVPKHIPVSEKEMEKYIKYTIDMSFGVADEYYRNTTGKGTPVGSGLNVIEMKVTSTDSGIDRGCISGSLMKAVKDFVPDLMAAPWEVICPDAEMDLKYLKARFALQNRNLVFMDSAFMTGLVDLMDYIRNNWEMLIRDIYHGRINPDVKIPDEIKDLLLSRIKPDKARARELLREFSDGFDTPIIPRIWPKMSWIGGIGTGGFYPYSKRMRKYAGKSIPFNNLCYAASESFMAVARHMRDESFVLLPDGGFYEFIPVKAEDESKTLNIDELEIGEDYEIVVTNLSGFYRYRLQDVIRVTGYYNETPIIKFLYRKNQLISIAGEKTNEDAIRWAVDEFSRELGIGVNDYSIYANTESEPGHYVLLLEPSKMIPKESLEYCRTVLDRCLSRANPSYGEKVRTGVLKELELVPLQQQTYQLYREMLVMRGNSYNQIKPVRVIDTPAKEKFFFGLREDYE